MIREIAALAEAMGIPFEKDMVEANLKILSNLVPEATTSMQRDVLAGKNSGMEARLVAIEDYVRMGAVYGVPVPVYRKNVGGRNCVG